MQYAIEYYDAANGSKYNGESVMYRADTEKR